MLEEHWGMNYSIGTGRKHPTSTLNTQEPNTQASQDPRGSKCCGSAWRTYFLPYGTIGSITILPTVFPLYKLWSEQWQEKRAIHLQYLEISKSLPSTWILMTGWAHLNPLCPVSWIDSFPDCKSSIKHSVFLSLDTAIFFLMILIIEWLRGKWYP